MSKIALRALGSIASDDICHRPDEVASLVIRLSLFRFSVGCHDGGIIGFLSGENVYAGVSAVRSRREYSRITYLYSVICLLDNNIFHLLRFLIIRWLGYFRAVIAPYLVSDRHKPVVELSQSELCIHLAFIRFIYDVARFSRRLSPENVLGNDVQKSAYLLVGTCVAVVNGVDRCCNITVYMVPRLDRFKAEQVEITCDAEWVVSVPHRLFIRCVDNRQSV